MRVQVSVNNGTPVRASLNSRGSLGVHLRLTTDDGTRPSDASFLIHAIDYSQEPHSVSSGWDLEGLAVGDRATVELLEDGEADPPTRVERSTETQSSLFPDVDQARQLLSAISKFAKELSSIADKSRDSESDVEFKKIARAIGSIFAEVDRNLIEPTLRRHPELLAEAQEQKLV